MEKIKNLPKEFYEVSETEDRIMIIDKNFNSIGLDKNSINEIIENEITIYIQNNVYCITVFKNTSMLNITIY